MKNSVKKFLSEAGYSDDEIVKGFEYADNIGYSDEDELGQLTLSKILYTEEQLNDGTRAGWEKVDWAEWEDAE